MLEPKVALKSKRIEIRAETRFTSRKGVAGKRRRGEALRNSHRNSRCQMRPFVNESTLKISENGPFWQNTPTCERLRPQNRVHKSSFLTKKPNEAVCARAQTPLICQKGPISEILGGHSFTNTPFLARMRRNRREDSFTNPPLSAETTRSVSGTP